MNKMEAFYQAIYDANNGVSQKEYQLESTIGLLGFKKIADRNHHISKCEIDERETKATVTFN